MTARLSVKIKFYILTDTAFTKHIYCRLRVYALKTFVEENIYKRKED